MEVDSKIYVEIQRNRTTKAILEMRNRAGRPPLYGRTLSIIKAVNRNKKGIKMGMRMSIWLMEPKRVSINIVHIN